MRRIIIILLVIISVLWSCCVFAEKEWYRDHERGWFWYELIPDKLPEEPEEQHKPGAPTQVTIAAPQEPKSPAPLSADWFRENLEKYEKIAIDNPSPENVAAFLYLQRVMLDKSQRFAEQVKHVVQMDPFLDQGTRRPIASYGGAQYSKEVLATRSRLMAEIAQKAGIFFFFQGGCSQCEIQAPVLISLKERDGFVIFPISINGMPLRNNLFAEYATDRGQARRLQVIQTPAMFLGKPDTKDIIPLGQSALSRDQLEERILVAARDAGWIDPKEFNSTRGFNANMALELKKGSLPQNIKEQELIEYIKKLYSDRPAGIGGITLREYDKNCEECQAN